MLLPQIKISQEYCDELTIKDITPAYSPVYPGGYGSINVDVSEITLTKVKLDFGKGRVYSYETPYNQSKEDIIISASDFDLKQPITGSCNNCGYSDNVEVEESRMQRWPEGCIDIIYEVYSNDNSASGKKLEGVKVMKFISTCETDKKWIELADKITTPKEDGYYDMAPEERDKIMWDINLVWAQLKLMEVADGCDCDCIAGRIKKIGIYLNSIKL